MYKMSSYRQDSGERRKCGRPIPSGGGPSCPLKELREMESGMHAIDFTTVLEMRTRQKMHWIMYYHIPLLYPHDAAGIYWGSTQAARFCWFWHVGNDVGNNSVVSRGDRVPA